MTLTSLRTPKEGCVASSDKWKHRSLSTKHPEIPVYELEYSPQLQGVDTTPIQVRAGTRVAAVRIVVQDDVGQLQGIDTSAISITASTRELKVYADFVDDGLREELTYVPVAGQL